jgi:hypothetical protein
VANRHFIGRNRVDERGQVVQIQIVPRVHAKAYRPRVRRGLRKLFEDCREIAARVCDRVRLGVEFDAICAGSLCRGNGGKIGVNEHRGANAPAFRLREQRRDGVHRLTGGKAVIARGLPDAIGHEGGLMRQMRVNERHQIVMRIAFNVEFAIGKFAHERGERRHVGCFDVTLIGARMNRNPERTGLQHDSGTMQKVRNRDTAATVSQQRNPINVARKMRHALTSAHTENDIVQHLNEQGFARVSAASLCSILKIDFDGLRALEPSWNDLPRDQYLRDGGRYRSRRHGSFVQELATKQLNLEKHRAHWQPTDYNALHGGIERWFEPLHEQVSSDNGFHGLLIGLGNVFAKRRAEKKWFIEAHQFRIDTAEGVGRPTPEGAHRDGVHFVAVILVQRGDMRGGESRVFEADGPNGVRFTLSHPWTALLLDDERVIHETTPILPGASAGVRDTLVLTYRAGSFQDPI